MTSYNALLGQTGTELVASRVARFDAIGVYAPE
jgi:hypothetical protein